ncbi:LysM peptidoglycan-binding domain-containing protein [Caldovatus sp. SYSU G05006]|uniref:LysM peptidoglycan-binding domain-containing protein n=2 Tax=Caldovatus aquaticus TaxID=2865671 RepID=A0ABS7F2D3_9PROT|nr:LysM peptidoglycan-binding domain-containing protein [Caldovatus aquaticus]
MAGPDTLVVLVPEPPPLVAAAPAPQGAPAPERGPPLAPPPAGAPEAPAIAPSLPNPPPNFAARDGAAAPVRSGDAAPAPAGPSGTATGPGASGPSVTAATPFAVLLPPPAPLAGAPGAGGADAAAPRVLQASSGGPAPAGPAGAPARAGTGAAPRLALEAVEYDESGAMRFSGTAAPGAAVRLYVDQRHAGDARADAAGRWAFLMTEAPSFGVHTLRVDQVVADGTVAARIELPFQRDRVPPPDLARRGREAAAAAGGEAAGAGAAAGASPPVAQAGRIIVQPGHNLWRIARETYGRGVRYTIIYQANREQIRDPDLIYPGQIFALPAPEAAVSAAGQPAPAESSRSR